MFKKTKPLILTIVVLMALFNLTMTNKIGEWPFTTDLKDTTVNA
jgi:hypothetical protein